MEIHCTACKKKYILSPEQAEKLVSVPKIPCPACGTLIITQIEKPAFISKEKLLKQTGALPPMPEILIRAKSIIDSPYGDIRDLADILEKDQAMTSRLLKLANSAYYGLRYPVESAHKACLVLGEQTLLQMITIVSTSKLFSNNLDGYDLDAATVFSHALFVALVSRDICKNRFKVLENSAFAAGLLHDAGMLVLDSHIKNTKAHYRKLRDKGLSQHAAEKEFFGFDHAEIGYDFCINWNVPADQALAIRWHHEPRMADSDLAHVLYTADILAWQDPDRIPGDDLDEVSFRRVGLSSEELHEIRSRAWQDVAQIVADILIS
ncbi:HDOD domain-containing protein [Desulfobotulus mexicanus]|uniref:HDOD domain-containing protein n=1 Tax=Desulfobotulus mexicanus TaxID=2586642 RepID=A0A5Q4VD36_9BACT|nr:HDOD domain-containing protein [Desulfobotulus mexicanus]TYT74836.1 HDOD domain-containing protein [Desulfobotulus mexicanus]